MRHFLAAILVLMIVLVGGCHDEKHDTPEATFAALRKVVEKGQAEKLTKFVYAENKNMRRLLDRFGVFLGHLQDLASAVQQKFPKEVADLRAKAETAAKDGKSSSFLTQITTQMRSGRGKKSVSVGVGAGPGANSPDKLRDSFDDAMRSLFTDPYAWIEQSEKRLSTEFLTDNTVTVLWDGEAVLPPIGMIMKKDTDDQWYFMLPTNFPGLNKIFPKTDKEFEIWGGLITVFDKMVLDLTKEVKAGHVRTLDDLSRRAGEMAFMPAMITVFAYAQLEENQKKAAAKAPKPPPPAAATPAPQGS